MQSVKNISLALLLVVLMIVVVGCGGEEGPMEKMGKKIDQTMDHAQKSVEDMTKSIKPEEPGALEKTMGEMGKKMDSMMDGAEEAMDKFVDDAKAAMDKATQ